MAETSTWLRDFTVATQEDTKRPWAGNPRNFRCGFCGQPIRAGMEFRMVFTNDMKGAGGNPLTCRACWDGNGGTLEAARSKYAANVSEFKELMRGRLWHPARLHGPTERE